MRSLNTTVPKVCQYVRWSEVPVHWSRDDHPEHILDGYYAMVVCPVIQGYEFFKCLMDGDSSLNIMYVETLKKLGLTKAQLLLVLSLSMEWFLAAKLSPSDPLPSRFPSAVKKITEKSP
jgi:hypothetical protein